MELDYATLISPKYDIRRFYEGSRSISSDRTGKENLETAIYRVASILTPAIRSGLIGVGLGLIVGANNDFDLIKSAEIGAVTGMYLDYFQLCVRMLIDCGFG